MRTAGAAALILLGLSATAAAQDTGGTEFFESKIRPLLTEHCIKCHGEKKSKGGLRLDSKAAWEKGGDSGPAVLPKKASSSPLIRMVRAESGSLPQMPPDGPLPAGAVADLVKWIDLGAPDPRNAALPAPVVKQIDWKAAGEFWSFQPVAAPGPASIDRLVETALAEKGLQPVGRADRWTLIRRVTFDLTGLAPTEAEVKAFVDDRSPDAFAKVVDRLLASPAYGENQGRRWLDLARYAEDQAHVTEGKLGHGWRYRDWVIEAFNKDLPYDRFVKLQLAADLMEGPEGDPTDRRALGFLGLGNIYARPNDIPRAKAEQWDDRVDTLTRTFLGLTVSCARCHDHKFDPIPTLDYYSLTGIIASTKDAVLSIAPKEQQDAYDAAAAKSTEIGARATDFLQLETDRRALEKLDSLVADTMAVWADPKTNKALSDYLKKQKLLAPGEAPSEAAAKKFHKQMKDNLSHPHKKRNMDEYKAMFGEKGVYPLTEKIVVDAATDEWRAAYAPLVAAAKEAATAVPPEPPKAHAVSDNEKPADLRVYLRGNPHKLGEPAPRRFLHILAGADAAKITKGSGRLDLADAIADARNPLTARVMANRIWQQHFGRGLVATPSNFGALGARPTHPALLDLLADRFVRSGWSVKKLHREILLTEAYQRASTSVAKNEAVDPENQWLWRVNRRRLTVEELRDAVLQVSGGLDRALGGASVDVDDVKNVRRTVYSKVSRMELAKLLRLFDFPDPNLTSERRIDTTLPQQSLFLLNSAFMIDRAKALAARTSTETTPAATARRIYETVFARAPSPEETAVGAAFLSAEDAGEGRSKIGLTRAERFAQALLASNPFLFID